MASVSDKRTGLPLVQKVVAYVTKGERLLVFRHVDVDAGIQAPAGTLEAGESPAAGVLREAREETGIDSLAIRRFLGSRDYNMKEYGINEIHRRYFFHLECTGDAPDAWRHFEIAASGSAAGPIEFEFFWVRALDEIPDLAAGQGDFLGELADSLASAG